VLDGGHLLFLLIEGLLRRPLPLRVREMAHIVGMAILIGLMLLAFKNDIDKRWGGAIGQRAALSAERAV
jgi:regulator of sigma E protease